jgi:hypothetical protein
MVRNFSKKIISSFVLFTSLFFAFLPQLSKAEENEVQSASDLITVFPAKFELWAAPDKTLDEYLKITNEADYETIAALSVDSFSIASEDGTVVLGQNFSLPNNLPQWIDFEKKGIVFKPKETKYINYKINIPKNAFAGGNYGAIVVSMDKLNRPANENSAVSKVVSLIMLSIAGDIRDEAFIQDYRLEKKNQQDGSGYNFIFKTKNNGNNHIKPKGMIVVSNIFGQKIAEIPLEGENVLPNVSRVITTSWKPEKVLFGRYNATLIANYGQKEDKKITDSIAFFVFPWWAVNIFWLAVVFTFLYTFKTKIKSVLNLKTRN